VQTRGLSRRTEPLIEHKTKRHGANAAKLQLKPPHPLSEKTSVIMTEHALVAGDAGSNHWNTAAYGFHDDMRSTFHHARVNQNMRTLDQSSRRLV